MLRVYVNKNHNNNTVVHRHINRYVYHCGIVNATRYIIHVCAFGGVLYPVFFVVHVYLA